MTIIIKLVIASMCMNSNSDSVSAAKEKFKMCIKMIEPLTTTTHTNMEVNNQIRDRQGGWLI